MLSGSVVYYLLLLITLSNKTHSNSFCGDRKRFEEPRGKIETNFGTIQDMENCSWSIETPRNSVVLIKFDYLQLGSYDEIFQEEDNCIYITSQDKKIEHLKLCTDVTYYDTLSLPINELLITLQVTSESHLSLTYSSYMINCSYNDLKCFNSRLYSRKIEKVCTDGMLVCGSLCRYGSVICGEFCYDINKQRCDGIIDCPRAEDELGCNPHICPRQINCPNENKCLESEQICDEKIDCETGFDESTCASFSCRENESNCNIERIQENKPDTNDITYILAVVFAVMMLLFIYLICRCLARRDNIRRMMDNPLDVPLPPFTGPESATSAEETFFTDDDFKPGGDIYESYMANVEKIKNRRKNNETGDENDITIVKPPDGQNVIDKYFNGVKPVLSEEMAALATLKITRDECYGLRKTKSEERPMTKLLFIDNKDDLSDASDAENEIVGPKFQKRFGPGHSKSDTDYVKRKSNEAKFL